MAKIKKNWEEAHLPIKDLDSNILRSLVKIKSDFDKKKRHGFSEGELEAFKKTTAAADSVAAAATVANFVKL